MTFDSFLHKIPEIKQLEPFGLPAQELMLPTQIHNLTPLNEDLQTYARHSAVMMLLYPKAKQMVVLLIQRALSKGIHSGQIGFPGGGFEAQDKDLKQTALRETQEELGIEPSSIHEIKAFTKLYIAASNYVVQPFFGIMNHTPIINKNESEVASIIELPLKDLLSNDIVQTAVRSTSYASNIDVPAFVYKDSIIWGATAMMLSELRETLKSLPAFK